MKASTICSVSGYLSADYMHVGRNSIGDFNQTGGTLDVGWMALATNSGSDGYYGFIEPSLFIIPHEIYLIAGLIVSAATI